MHPAPHRPRFRLPSSRRPCAAAPDASAAVSRRHAPAWLGLLCGLLLLPALHPARAGTLYDQLGGQEGITRIVAGMYRHVLSDGRVSAKFENIDTDFIQRQLVQQLCELTGGPCHYRGPSMHGGHSGLGITDRDFNAVVEDLQDGMDDAGTPFMARGRLLALLAPMHGQIVSR